MNTLDDRAKKNIKKYVRELVLSYLLSTITNNITNYYELEKLTLRRSKITEITGSFNIN